MYLLFEHLPRSTSSSSPRLGDDFSSHSSSSTNAPHPTHLLLFTIVPHWVYGVYRLDSLCLIHTCTIIHRDITHSGLLLIDKLLLLCLHSSYSKTNLLLSTSVHRTLYRTLAPALRDETRRVDDLSSVPGDSERGISCPALVSGKLHNLRSASVRDKGAAEKHSQCRR